MDEIKKNEDYVPRDHKQSRFDKRLIHKIVKEVEQGLPRKEANRIYGFGKASLDTWMRRYGSPEYRENIKRRTYTNLQKRTIVTAIEQSRMSIKEAQIAYNIKSEKTIREWLSLFKLEKVEICIEKAPPMAKKTTPIDTAEVLALQKTLEEAQLRIKALNTLIDVAEEQLKIDIRKKYGAKQSSK